MENFGWPEYIIATWIALGFIGRLAASNGWRPKKTHHTNAFYGVCSITFPVFWITILYYGGFW